MFPILFLFLLFSNNVECDNIQTHELDINWHNEFMHRSAIMALLTTKATVLKRDLPQTESIIYKQCALTARSPSTLAGCVVKLLNARDQIRLEKLEENGSEEVRAEPKSQAELYEKMQELINEVLGKKSQVEELERVEPAKVLYRPKKSIEQNQNTALYNLQRVQRYMTMIEKYNKHLVKLNEENAKFINQASLPNIQFKVQPKHNLTMMDKVLELVNSFKNSKNSGKLSILSPKILSIIPSRKNRPKLLSPTLFSFQQDGLFSLPQLFQLSSISRNETDAWLQTLLNLSGADKELQKVVKTLEPQLNEFEQKIQPRLIELERWNRQLKRVRQTYSSEQREQLKTNGYSFLTPDQMSLVYGSPLAPTLSNEARMFAHLTTEQREKRLEDDIRSLAKLSSMIPSTLHSTQNIKTKFKRQTIFQSTSQKLNGPIEDQVELIQNVEVKYGSAATKNNKIDRDDKEDEFVKVESTFNNSFNSTENCNENEPNCSPLRPPTSTQKHVEPIKSIKSSSEEGLKDEKSKEEEKEELPKFETLKPFAFGSRINEAVVLEGLTLSPYAFFSQIAQPEMLNFEILSPRAFVPSILSPSALIARVLSPAAFRAEILSPRTLVAWVLTPEALILEVLSPKAIETRILSPEALIIQVLSPNTLAPKIYSPEAVGVVVLSPSFLSPRFMSKEKMMVEVLSPNILGGGSSEESKETGSNEHETHDENSDHMNENEASGEAHEDHENHLGNSQNNENDVQSTWHLKPSENGQHLPTKIDSTSRLYSMHDWET